MSMRTVLSLLPLLLGACSDMPSPAPAAPSKAASSEAECNLSEADRAWINRAMTAWDLASREITRIGKVEKITALFFDDRCVVTSATAMNGGPRVWTSDRHQGQVQVPGGPLIPAGVTSFAMGGEGRNLFVMSTPSVWRAAKKSDNGIGSLEVLMTGVVLHEATHVAQIPTYGRRMEALAEKYKLPEDFNDDSIQKRFEGDAEFAGSLAREMDLLFRAADATGDADARNLARQARALMLERQKRWFTGADSYLTEAEDIWLTMEGSGQWTSYQWAVHPEGGGVARPVAFRTYRESRWWTQAEGFALFMVLDRLAGDSWRKHAFGDGAKTVLQMLDEALDAKPS